MPLPFQQMFASNVPVIGVADPARVVEEKRKVTRIEDGKSNDEKWAALLAESSGDVVGDSSAVPTPAKGKKRAKKAV